MPYMNNKGLSQVITVILIIMLIVVAAAILFAAVMKPIGSLAPNVKCSTQAIKSTIKIDKACLNMDGEIEVQITKKLDDTENKQILFTASNNQDRYAWGCGSPYACDYCKTLTSGQTKTYYLNDIDLQKAPDNLVVSVDGCVLGSEPIEIC